MNRSPGFGSIRSDKCPIQTRFRSGSGFYSLTTPLPISRRLILQQARGQALYPPTACQHTVSCSISLPFWGSFHLSLAVLFRYRSLSSILPYLAVQADSHGISRVPCYSGLNFNLIISFYYGTFTLYG
jgi:hypothetical protein